jgi:hypothetical protein
MKAEARFFGKTEIRLELELELRSQPGGRAVSGVMAENILALFLKARLEKSLS